MHGLTRLLLLLLLLVAAVFAGGCVNSRGRSDVRDPWEGGKWPVYLCVCV